MAKILKINYSYKNLKKLLDKRLGKLDYEGALCVLNSMRNNNVQNFETYENYARIYYIIEEYELAINYWYKYLNSCPKRLEVEGYNGLGACFYKLDSKKLAGYYFNEQLKIEDDEVRAYNNIASDYFIEITDKKSMYYLAYPYNLANFDKLFEAVANYIRLGYIEKALSELEIVPSDSKYYPDALAQKSLCKFLMGNTEEALKDIALAVELDKENGVFLINAISMFYASNKKAETEKLLNLLINSKIFSNEEFYDKIAMIYCEIKDYVSAESFFDKHLKKHPYKLSSLLLNGITKYNLFKFDEAIELFSRYLRINDCYLIRYYIKTSKLAKKRYENARVVRPLSYAFDLQNYKLNQIEKRFDYFLELVVIEEKFYKEIIDLISYAFESKKLKLQAKSIIILSKIDKEISLKLMHEYLIRVEAFDNIKRSMISFIIENGFSGKLKFIFGNVYQNVDIFMPNYKGLKTSVVKKRTLIVCQE